MMSYDRTVPAFLRDIQQQQQQQDRTLLPKPSSSGGGGGGSRGGCQSMSCNELESAWFWGGKYASCPGGLCDAYDDDSSSGGSGGGSGGSDDSSGGGGGDDDTSYYDDDDTTTTTTTTSESKDYDDYYDDPYSTFDISDCTAYSNTWLWDLTLTCDPDDLENLTNCQCSTAQNLFDAGIIECADTENSSSSPPACPADCTVCQTCMVLLGCPDIYPKNTSNNLRHAHVSTAGKFAMMTMLASAVGVGVALVLQRVNHRNEVKNLGKSQSLPAALIGAGNNNNNNGGVTRCEVNQETGKTVWLAPIS
eukprot:CAMPEP_0116019092 /NCGR_PEP_ID=MMETSP0321-20121206/9026_1 /TAXON_ID=163516 /ORGANISM="Leptocylindrus danicus var. danicus, Strain B650" /LENGTH=305 /DNA_ID=CAMNT_0003489587 /DNA_START=129 /DNA_END=1046 /DNA_ORIENTATION=-